MARRALIVRWNWRRLYGLAIITMPIVAVGCWGEPEPRRLNVTGNPQNALAKKTRNGGDPRIARQPPSGRP